ncbi:MAG: MOSC domain-containing protein [Chloroflexi bacterium]|nr:MOSC domain-containing protein [Chloroflexota bacterium]
MASPDRGQIVSLQLCVGHREPMKAVGSANAVAGFGIEGDRHATSEGVRTARQVLLMDEETLATFKLSRADVRENVTTSGIELHSLKRGQQLALGDEVVLRITGHCAPCSRMDEIRPGLQQALEGHRGMLATVVRGGTIKVGDAVRVLERAAASSAD